MGWLQGGVLTGLLAAVGWLVKTWLWRKKPEAEYHLTGSQAELNYADAEQKRVGAKVEVFDRLSAYIDRLEAKLSRFEAREEEWAERGRQIVRLERAVKRVSDERDKAQARVKALEKQLKDTEGDDG